MEVKINREIRNYTEAMFFGLSMRQFIFSACACVVAVGLYFLLKPYVGTETVSWMCILGAAPFAALGFIKYNGMTAEKFVWAWFKSEFLMPNLCQLLVPSFQCVFKVLYDPVVAHEKHLLFIELRGAPAFSGTPLGVKFLSRQSGRGFPLQR